MSNRLTWQIRSTRSEELSSISEACRSSVTVASFSTRVLLLRMRHLCWATSNSRSRKRRGRALKLIKPCSSTRRLLRYTMHGSRGPSNNNNLTRSWMRCHLLRQCRTLGLSNKSIETNSRQSVKFKSHRSSTPRVSIYSWKIHTTQS